MTRGLTNMAGWCLLPAAVMVGVCAELFWWMRRTVT